MYANSDRENGVCSDAKVGCTVWVILQYLAILNFLDLFSTVFIKFTATVIGTVLLKSAGAYYYVYTMYVHIWFQVNFLNPGWFSISFVF